jgi:hypothetical protein
MTATRFSTNSSKPNIQWPRRRLRMKLHGAERFRALPAALVAAVVGVPPTVPTPSLTVYCSARGYRQFQNTVTYICHFESRAFYGVRNLAAHRS